jgi:hypothetical protein
MIALVFQSFLKSVPAMVDLAPDRLDLGFLRCLYLWAPGKNPDLADLKMQEALWLDSLYPDSHQPKGNFFEMRLEYLVIYNVRMCILLTSTYFCLIQPSLGAISRRIWKSATAVTLPAGSPGQPMAPLPMASIFHSLLGLCWHLLFLLPAGVSNWSCSISFHLMYYFKRFLPKN